MKTRNVLFVGALLIGSTAACSGDDIVDGASDVIDDAAAGTVATQLSSYLVDNTNLDQAQADCVSNDVVDRLGASTVVKLVVDTGGDFTKLSQAERDQLEGAVRAAGEACTVDVSNVMG